MQKIKSILQGKSNLILIFGSLLLFFFLFDGLLSYLIPLVVTEHIKSKTLLGVILGAAAISGAFFDFTIYKIFKNAFYRRLFIAMFLAAFIYLALVWVAESFLLYLIAMCVWGFYYDLKNFGTLDFVSRYSQKKELASNFGTIQIFQSIGYLLAPLVAGFLIVDYVDWEPFALALVFLAISALFFILLLQEVKTKKQHLSSQEHNPANLRETLLAWRTVGIAILPVLFLSSFSTLFDSFFMALGPLVAEALPLEPFDGLFMVAYFLPPLLVGGLIGYLVNKFGEKKTVTVGLLIGGVILGSILIFQNPLLIILVVFASSCFICVMNPVAQSIYAHCIHEAPKAKKEVQELGDFFGNAGYVVGPILAGFIADEIGTKEAFSLLGIMAVAFAILFLILMPKKLKMKK
jgi:MFS family permease